MVPFLCKSGIKGFASYFLIIWNHRYIIDSLSLSWECTVWLYTRNIMCCLNKLDSFMLTIVKNCISCSVELLLFLFVRGLKIVVLVHELGTEDQQIGHQVICFLEVAPKKKSADWDQEHLRNGNNKFEIPLLLFLFTSYGKVLSLCLPSCRSACKVLMPVVKCNTQWCCGF